MNGKPHVVTMHRVMAAVALLAAAFYWAVFPAAFALAAQVADPPVPVRARDADAGAAVSILDRDDGII
jgi:hypothetical protein